MPLRELVGVENLSDCAGVTGRQDEQHRWPYIMCLAWSMRKPEIDSNKPVSAACAAGRPAGATGSQADWLPGAPADMHC